jgi:copper chaperone CopZ
MRIETGTRDLPGVTAVRASVEDRTATFELESTRALQRVKQVLAEIGYPGE